MGELLEFSMVFNVLGISIVYVSPPPWECIWDQGSGTIAPKWALGFQVNHTSSSHSPSSPTFDPVPAILPEQYWCGVPQPTPTAVPALLLGNLWCREPCDPPSFLPLWLQQSYQDVHIIRCPSLYPLHLQLSCWGSPRMDHLRTNSMVCFHSSSNCPTREVPAWSAEKLLAHACSNFSQLTRATMV